MVGLVDEREVVDRLLKALGRRLAQRVDRHVALITLDPREHVAHRRPLKPRRPQQRRQIVGARATPVNLVLRAPGRLDTHLQQRVRDTSRQPPGLRRRDRRPRPAGNVWVNAGGVKHLDLAHLAALGDRLSQNVALDRYREHRPLPLKDVGDHQPRRLERHLRQPRDQHRRALLGRDHRAGVAAEDHPPRLRAADAQRFEVPHGRPARRLAPATAQASHARHQLIDAERDQEHAGEDRDHGNLKRPEAVCRGDHRLTARRRALSPWS